MNYSPQAGDTIHTPSAQYFVHGDGKIRGQDATEIVLDEIAEWVVKVTDGSSEVWNVVEFGDFVNTPHGYGVVVDTDDDITVYVEGRGAGKYQPSEIERLA